ncbi:MAG TPA: multiheme c-type cytochrome [Verrucomicrobiae bacterium]
MGTQSCTGSGCHGGAAAHQNQYLVWSTRDFHSLRPFATLTTARSKQIADELRIADPTRDARCTTCHAPLAQVPAPLQAVVLNAKEGVSCESCHGPAERWLGSHTRPDYSRADRVASGMRDLKNLYVRANTCVACHQTVELPLLRAGHPELIFELDGQSVTEPKHWRVERDAPGPQAWLVGQAAALREMSWQLARERGADEKLTARWQALRWLLVKVELLGSGAKAPTAVQSAADELARRAAAMTWSDALTRQHLRALADSAADFRDGKVSAPMHAHRAERLVLALDRLVVGLDLEKGTKSPKVELERLFMLAQSVPDFEPERFAAALESFAARVR